MFPNFNKLNSPSSNRDYSHSFIKEINIKENIPHSKRTISIMIICWILIFFKCAFVWWAVSHYKISFSAWWIIAPTLAFASWVTALYIWKE
jgi:hypothetical protein